MHLQQRVDASVQAALATPRNSPWPDARELATDVYA